MIIYLKYDINAVCRKVLEEQLDKLELSYSILGFAEFETSKNLSNEKKKLLRTNLNHYGIDIVESQKSILVQKTKDAIIEIVFTEEELPFTKISSYLAEKLKYSYGYISNIFSEVTYTSIENFIILQKIDRAKQLIVTNELTFTEIAWKLNYSSVAHFSNQFKNTTGITPSAFQRIINKRRISNKLSK